MFRKVAVLMGSLVALSACGYTLRARIVPNSGPIIGQCLDGSVRTSRPVDRICHDRRDRVRASYEAQTPSPQSRLDAQASLRPGHFGRLRVAEMERHGDLLLPTFSRNIDRLTDAQDEPTSRSLVERFEARRRMAPDISMPRVIDISRVLSALRGSVD